MSVHVIKAPAGLGKTTLILDKIKASKHKRVEIYLPTVRLAEEVAAKLLVGGVTAEVMLGRDYKMADGKTKCQRADVARALAQRGYPIFEIICMGPGKHGDPLSIKACQFFSKCEYLGQFRSRARVIIYTHAYLPLDRNSKERKKPSLVIIDESFLSTCLTTSEIPVAQLPSPLATVLVEACNVEAQKKPFLAFLRKKKLTSKKLSRMRDDFGISYTHNQDLSDTEFIKDIKTWRQYKDLDNLLKFLAAELESKRDECHAVTYDHSKQLLKLHYRKPITRFSDWKRQPNIILIDANADLELVRPWFPDATFTEYSVRRNAYVVQCSSTRGATSSFAPEKNDNAETKKRVEHTLEGISGLIANESADGTKKVLVVGPQAVTGNPKKAIVPLVPCPKNGALAHFGALRGVDAYKDFDTVIIIGRNQPPIDALENLARALWYDAMEPLKLGAEDWVMQDRPYRFRDATKAVGVQALVHPDPRIQRLHEQLREGESTQAIDRLRLIHSKTQKRVIVLSSIPLGLEIDELVDLNTLLWMSRLERAWSTLNGVMPLNSAWLAERFPALWATSNAARMDIRAAVKKGQIVNSIYINNSTLLNYHYRVNEQKRHTRVISTRPYNETVLELNRLLGVPMMFRDVSGDSPGAEHNVAMGNPKLQPLATAA